MASLIELVVKQRIAEPRREAEAGRLVRRVLTERRQQDMRFSRTDRRRRSAGPLRPARVRLTSWFARATSMVFGEAGDRT